ncbi:PLD nuclease N-terminal domain-containing protein [Kitasatospora sp. NPDC049258]|uniref:PLD nuclease N-terminal domain-containing protein n=1 Tax=Kitasatospora sp. NPDC049258 TaxID=3155394 RepID=UPI0034252B09
MNAPSAPVPVQLQAIGDTGRLVLAGGVMTMALAAALAALLLAVAALVSVLRSRLCNATKILWLAIVLFAPFLGSLAWFAFGRRGTGRRTASH